MELRQSTEAEPHHGVSATVAQVRPDLRRELLEVGVGLALQTGRRVRILGIRRSGEFASCTMPDCELDNDAPEVIPAMFELELAANGWVEPEGTRRLFVRDRGIRTSVLAVGWPPSSFSS